MPKRVQNVESVGDSTPDGIQERASKLENKMHKLQTKHRPPSKMGINGEYGSGFYKDQNAPSNEFPVKTTPIDPYDTKYQMKRELIGSNKFGSTPLGHVNLEQADLDYLERKKQVAERVDYDRWLANRFDIRNPVEAEYFERIVPSYFKDREKQIDEVADLQKNIAKLRLWGPRSEDDLQIEYALLNGKIDLPDGPLWDPSRWHPGKDSFDQVFSRGWFSPKRWFGPVADAYGHMRYDPMRKPTSEKGAVSRTNTYSSLSHFLNVEPLSARSSVPFQG